MTAEKFSVWRIVQGLAVRAGAAVVVATLGHAVAPHWWVAELLTHFTLQYLMILVAALIILAAAGRWRACVPLLLAAVVNAAIVLAATGQAEARDGPAKATLDGRNSLVVMSQNVLASNHQFESLIAEVRRQRPDLVAFLEVTPEWWAALQEGLAHQYPYAHFEPHEGNFGQAVFSQVPWEAVDSERFGSSGIPTIHVNFRLDDGRLFEWVVAHPVPPLGEQLSLSRNGQLLTTVANMNPNALRMVVGDLNLTPWSPWFRELLRRGELRDAALGWGVEPTWYAFPTWLGGLRIDHVLVSPRIRVDDYRVGGEVGSDHRAVIVKVRFLD